MLSQTTWINAQRILTGVSKVKAQYEPPAWLKKKLRAATTREFKMISRYWRASRVFQNVLQQIIEDEKNALTTSYMRVWDHPGHTTIAGQKCFVLEPYPPGRDLRDWETNLSYLVDRLAKVLNCSVVWTRTSWWYPENTYRIVFSERPIGEPVNDMFKS